MKSRVIALGVLVATLSGAALGSGAEWSLPLTVEEPSGLARTAEPVSGGIPLKSGQFAVDQKFALFEAGKEVPVQVVPLVIDEKGFLRWVLVDFQTDLGPKERRTFTLKATPPTVRIPNAIRVLKDGRSLMVDTGAVTFTVAEDRPFGLLNGVSVRRQPVAAGGEASYTDGFDGKRYVADKPESVTLEYDGPMRTTVCAKGRFVGDADTHLQYVARITAWAGKSAVHVKYTLVNSNGEHYCYRQIKDSTASLKFLVEPHGTMLGAGKAVETPGEAWMQQSSRVVSAAIHRSDSLAWARWYAETPGAAKAGGAKAVADGRDLWVSQGGGDQSEGWLAVKYDNKSIFAADLYFVEDPPRRLEAANGRLLLTGVTEPLEDAARPFSDRTRWLFDCSHLSSQYVLDFAAPTERAALSTAAKRWRARPHVLAPLAWYFESEQLPVGTFGTQADELRCYDTWGWKYDLKDAPTGPVGQMARIPRWTCGDDNHFTSEQDTVESLLLMYLRTGARGFYDATETWVNYFMDLQTWRTDGWRWKDGGVWWHGGPAGNKPQRGADPVTGLRNSLPSEWTTTMPTKRGDWGRATCAEVSFLFLAKACHCHNWGEGLVEWFMLTGDRDAYEAAIDTVEQNYDTQIRAFEKAPGKTAGFSRDFTRACYLTNATRLVAPVDEFVVKASEELTRVFVGRPNREVRGLLNGPTPLRLPRPQRPKPPASGPALPWDEAKATQEAVDQWLINLVGTQGLAAMREAGVTMDLKTGQLADPKTGATWYPIVEPHTWMFPPMSRAMETYYRITSNEDAQDWLIAYGQAVAHVLFQPKHGNLSYGRMLADFPKKGVVKDWASWVLPEDCKNGEGLNAADGKPVVINGYLGQFYPDVAARAYSLCGDPFLKQRAYDYWYWSSHRGYNTVTMHNLGGVGMWVNTYTTHGESVCYTGRTFYEWAHPRQDGQPPTAVADLRVAVEGDQATVTFTAPADQGGGKVVRYQVKASQKPIVDYATFLGKFAANEDARFTNDWMAANVKGEPAPQGPGARESFVVTGVPEGARYFVVLAFDDSSNRSALSNVAEAGR
jgi:hypothetical protein